MSTSIDFSDQAYKVIRKLDATTRNSIKKLLERVSGMDDPKRIGKPLTASLQAFWRYRCGKYRIICKLYPEKHSIRVLDVVARDKAYKDKEVNSLRGRSTE